MTTYEFVDPPPMAHQRRGLRKIIDNGGIAGLLWEPGLGKTRTVIDYAGMLAEARGGALVLVFAPKSVIDTWPDEVDTWLPQRIERRVVVLDGTVLEKAEQVKQEAADHHAAVGAGEWSGVTMLVTNHDVLSHSNKVKGTKTVTTRGRMIDAIRAAGFDLCVVDESHRAKGRSSNLSRALRSLSRDLPRRLILTGTVAPHSPLDIWAQWAFLNPDRFGTRFLDFRDRYAVMGGWMGKEVTAFRHLDELRDRMAADATVVRRSEALDLPPVTERVIPVTLDPAERKAYDQMKQSLVLAVPTDPTGQPIIAPTAVVQWLRLRQLTSGHVGDADGETNIIGSSKVDTAVDLLTDLTEADEKVVVFAHFRPDVARTAEAARKRLGDSVPVWEISGDTSSKDRRRIRKAFKDTEGAAVVVAQMRTVSLGINEFVVAAHGIFLSMSERRDDWVQAKDRLDRNGQVRPVTLHYLVVPKSIDEVVLHTHRTKGRLERAITEMVREELDQRA